MAYCIKCGNQLRDGCSYCTKCGAPVKGAVESDMAGEVERHEETGDDEAIEDGYADAQADELNAAYESYVASAEQLKECAARLSERVKTTLKDTESSFRAASTGEDSAEYPFADKLSGWILAAMKLAKSPKKSLDAAAIKQWVVRNKVPLVLAMLFALAVSFLIFAVSISNSSKSASSSNNGYTRSSSTFDSGTTTSSKVTQKETPKTYAVHIKVKCNRNLLFSTYDVRIYIDGSLVADLNHGEEGSWDKDLTEGSHRIKICKKDDKDVYGTESFSITAESVVDCTVSTRSSQVEIEEFSCKTVEEIKKAEAEAEQKRQEEAQAKLEAQKYVPDGTGATYKVHFSISGWINTLFLKTRSINVYLDGSQMKAIADNDTAEWEQDLGGGKHTLRFADAEDDENDVMQSFTVADISYLSCQAALGMNGLEVENYSFETQTERDEAAEKARQKEAAEAEAKAKREAEAAEKAKVLTVENCEDLANMLNSSSSDASAFVASYGGRTIEFDGNIAYMSSHNGAKTRFDVLIYAGDYSETSAKGPHMQYKNVNYRDMGTSGIDSIQMGLNVRIRAVVDSYNSSTDILNLTPVSMTAR